MKIFFYGTDRVEPVVMSTVFEQFYKHLDGYKDSRLFPGLPTVYITIKDIDGDVVLLTDKDDPDLEVSWEVRTTPRQAEKSNQDLIFQDKEHNIYIYQHLDPRGGKRYS